MIFSNIAQQLPGDRGYLFVGLVSDTYETSNHTDALNAISEYLQGETDKLLNDSKAYVNLRGKIDKMDLVPVMFYANKPLMYNGYVMQKPKTGNAKAKRVDTITVTYDMVVIVERKAVPATEEQQAANN